MIILHFSYGPTGEFLLWAEGKADETPMVDGSLPADMPVPFAFRVELAALRSALKPFAPEIKVIKSRLTSEMFWLPSICGVPLPSSPLICELPDDGERLLKSFQVDCLRLSVEDAWQLAAVAAERRSPVQGVLFGDSVRWFAEVFQLANDFLVAEAFLPGLIPSPKNWEARWIPAPSEALFHNLVTLAQGMPGVVRCVSATPKSPPDSPPRDVLQQLVGRILDHKIRSRLVGDAAALGGPRTSLHDAWMAALSTTDPVVTWKNAEETAKLAAEIELWQRPINALTRAPFVFCFRVKEPMQAEEVGDDSETLVAFQPSHDWEIQYLLQPREDPSFQVPVADIWDNRGGVLKRLQKYGSAVAEFVLTALSQAGGISEGVARSLKEKQPAGFAEDTAGAFRFLVEEASVLRAAGFTVMLPKWWTGKAKALGVRAQVKSPKMGSNAGLGLDRVLQFNVEAAMDGEVLTPAELEALAKARMPLVQLRGVWTEVDPAQIKKAVQFLQKRKTGKMAATDLIRIALGADGTLAGIPIEGIDADGWLADLIDRLAGRKEFEELEQPPGLRAVLRPYQKRGMSWLRFLSQWGLGACLADDMGLGKTIQTLALLQACREMGEKRPVLLVCPTSVLNNWRKESEKFTPEIKTLIHHGTSRSKTASFAKDVEGSSMVVSSYGLMVRDLEAFAQVEWAGVVLDEAQYIKNPITKQAKCARSLKAGFRIALTGTPVENHVGELWSLMEFLNPGWLGSQAEFKRNFHVPIQRERCAETAERLRKITGPFILRRLKTDKSIISDLPEKMEIKDYCALTKEQAALYRSVTKDAEEQIAQSDGIERRGLVLGLLSRLKQVCNHPAQFLGDNSTIAGRSGKLDRLTEIVEEIREQDEGVLVFTQFTEMAKIILKHLQDTLCEEVLFLHGGLSRTARDKMVERFQSGDGPGVFLLSLKAAGTGLTLTRANHVVHYDRWWNPAVENQATDRAFRIGQKRNVQVRKFIVSGTLEEKIDEVMESKAQISDQVVGTGEDWLSGLSNEELRDLITLGKSATAA